MRRATRKKSYKTVCWLWLSVAMCLMISGPSLAGKPVDPLPAPALVAHIDLSSYSPKFYRPNVQIGDLNNDGIRDFLIYSNSKLMRAFAYDGKNSLTLLWEHSFPNLPDPPIKYHYKYTIWDMDNDGRNEVIGPFASSSGYVEIRILDGETGAVEKSMQTTIPNPTSSDDIYEWRLYATVANFRGLPTPQDVVFLTENDSYGEIYAYDNNLNLLWDTTGDTHQYIYAHFPWAYDIDADGKDELIGTWVFDHDGTKLWKATHPSLDGYFYNHIDRAFAGDVDPSHPGLEILLSHENYHYRMFDPVGNLLREEAGGGDSKIVGVGAIDQSTAGFESIIWDNAFHGKVKLYSATGVVLATLPRILDGYTVDWDGDRQKRDDFFCPDDFGMLYNPYTAEAVYMKNYYDLDRYTPADVTAQKIFAHMTDVWGDFREDVVIVDEDELLIYANTASTSYQHPSPWTIPAYRLRVANTEDDIHPERTFFDWQAQL
ncbi:MAG: hypothetical protein M1379_13520 [Firmicutes bacterium]|nr:hypothetical protein [Bacillota bacterium]